MKKILRIYLVLTLLFAISGRAGAQESQSLPDAGMTPDSSFYFLDKLGEQIGMMFAFGTEAKTKKQIEIAEERLAEANELSETGNYVDLSGVIEEYNKTIGEAALNVAKSAQSGENFSQSLQELLVTTNSMSQTVLSRVYEQVPEQAKKGIENAMQNSMKNDAVLQEDIQKMVNDSLKEVGKDVSGEVKNYGPGAVKKEDVQKMVNDGLEKAKGEIPEEAKAYVPGNVPAGNPEEMKKWQEQYKNQATEEAMRSAGAEAAKYNVPVEMPNVNIGR